MSKVSIADAPVSMWRKDEEKPCNPLFLHPGYKRAGAEFKVQLE